MSACSDACWQPNTTSSDITAFSLTEEENWRKPQLLYSFFLSQSPLRLTLKDYKNYLWHISAGTTGKFFFWGTVLNKFIRPHKYLRKNKSKTCLKLINILSVSCQIAETFSPKIWAGTLDWEVRTTGSNIKGGYTVPQWELLCQQLQRVVEAAENVTGKRLPATKDNVRLRALSRITARLRTICSEISFIKNKKPYPISHSTPLSSCLDGFHSTAAVFQYLSATCDAPPQ